MIIRIVKMTFLPEETENFLQVFQESKNFIRNFPGCTHLELLRQQDDPCVFFTYSFWENEQGLENYRNSELFSTVWAKTKPKFSKKPEAWSLNREMTV